MKRLVFLFLLPVILWGLLSVPAAATETADVYPYEYAFEEYWYGEALPAAEFSHDIACRGCVLMEASTGKVLYGDGQDNELPIASVTKIMATLLIMEAIDDGRLATTDTVTVSERAASMGGSQVYLEPGEKMSADDLLKSLIVSSANDATVALAEAVCGSEEAFIAEMNEKAASLGLLHTHFVNTNGLPAEGHYSSAYDVALTTRELLKHPAVLRYTTIWMDTIRDGAFGLANTNKLIRFYEGANGMKTGFTSEAGYCLSGTALRNGMQLIAVVLGASTGNDRFALAKQMLDYGFACYSVVTPEVVLPDSVPVAGGTEESVEPVCVPPSVLTKKGSKNEFRQEVSLPGELAAPVRKGDVIGTVVFYSGDEAVATAEIRAAESVDEMDFGTVFHRILTVLFGIF